MSKSPSQSESEMSKSPSQSESSDWSGYEESEFESSEFKVPRRMLSLGSKGIKDLEDEAYDLISKNDNDGLIRFLRRQLLTFFDISMSKRMLLEWAISLNADDCIIALIEEEILHPDSLTVNGIRPIHYAAANFKPHLVEALLRLGSKTSTRCDLNFLTMFKEEHGLAYDPFNPDYKNMLPLEVALRALRSKKYLSDWTAEISVFKLVLILCLPEMKGPMETIRMLVQSTNEVSEVAYHIARRLLVHESVKEGNEVLYMIKETTLVELAALLMVARENILGPIVFHGEFSDAHHVFHSEISRQINEEVKFQGRCQSMKLIKMLKKERVLMVSVFQLFEVFEKAGDAIEKYQRSQQPNVSEEQVTKMVASLLVEAGFSLEFKETYLSDVRSCYITRRSKHSGIAKESTQQTCYYVQHIVGSYCGRWRLVSKQMSNGYPDLSSVVLPFNLIKLSKQNFPGSRQWCHEMSETITKKEQLLRDFMPAKRLVKFAYIVKCGIRCL